MVNTSAFLIFFIILSTSQEAILVKNTRVVDPLRSSIEKINLIQENPCQYFECIQGAVTRGNISKKEITLVFMGGEYADGATQLLEILEKQNVSAGFFFTGDFYRNRSFKAPVDGTAGSIIMMAHWAVDLE